MGGITFGGIYRRGFELFRKNYKKFLLLAVIMYAVNITAAYLLQYITMPAQMGAIFAFEFGMMGLAAPFGGPAAEWEFGNNSWIGVSPSSSMSPAMASGVEHAVALGFFIAALVLIVTFYAAYAIIQSIVSGTFDMGAKHASIALADGEKPSFDSSFGYFGKNWRRCLGVTAWATLWSALWGLLFIVPGIVKAYSYRLAPYLVIQYPVLTVRQALRKSMEITKGHKGQLFVLDLILMLFGLGALLASCCFYFLPMIAASLFFISPLGYALFAVAYVEIRQEAAGRGLLGPAVENEICI